MFWMHVDDARQLKGTITAEHVDGDIEVYSRVIAVVSFMHKKKKVTAVTGKEVVQIIEEGETSYDGLYFDRLVTSNGAVRDCLPTCRKGPTFKTLEEGILWLATE